MPKCPECGSERVVKNGRIHTGKQNHRCRSCGRQFVENPQQKRISEETKVLIDKLLLERMSLAAIARVCDVSERWLQSYVNHLYDSVKDSALPAGCTPVLSKWYQSPAFPLSMRRAWLSMWSSTFSGATSWASSLSSGSRAASTFIRFAISVTSVMSWVISCSARSDT